MLDSGQRSGMRVFIAGATGVLGRRLVAACAERGHEVVGLSRNESGDAAVRDRGGEPVRGDVLDPESLREAASGAEVVVHAATAIPTSENPSEAAWERNDRVRRAGTEHLLDAAAAVGADRFVLQSVVWLARRPDGEPFDEDAELRPDRSTRSAADAERTLRERAPEEGLEPVVLRGGYFYAPDTAHTHLFGQRLLEGDLPVIARGLLGRRDAALSFIHADDVGQAFAAAVEGDATGTFHVVDDEPATFARYMRTFARKLGAPEPSRLPAWLARLFVDDNLVRLVSRPMPTTNDEVREAFGWAPEYPTIEEGLDQVVDAWRSDGTVVESGGGVRWAGP